MYGLGFQVLSLHPQWPDPSGIVGCNTKRQGLRIRVEELGLGLGFGEKLCFQGWSLEPTAASR